MRLFQSGEGCRDVGLGGAEVVRAEVRADHRQQDERHPDEALEGEVEGGHGADGDDDRHDELRDRGAEVAARGVESVRVAVLCGRVEERDVRHRAGEVAAAEAGEGGDEQEHAERSCGVRHRDGEADAGDEQHGGRDDGPVATAEARNHERVGDAQRGAHQARHGDEPEDLSPVDSWKPVVGSKTTTNHSCQTTKTGNSAKIHHRRLRAAMALPTLFHCSGFPGFQLSIQRPGRCVSSCAAASGVAGGAAAALGARVGDGHGVLRWTMRGGAAPRMGGACRQRREEGFPGTAPLGAGR